MMYKFEYKIKLVYINQREIPERTWVLLSKGSRVDFFMF